MKIMKKIFIIFFILFFLIKKDFIYAQQVNPTPEPGSLNGPCRMQDFDIEKIDFKEITSKDGWGCIKIPSYLDFVINMSPLGVIKDVGGKVIDKAGDAIKNIPKVGDVVKKSGDVVGNIPGVTENIKLFCLSDVLLVGKDNVSNLINFKDLEEEFRNLNICDGGLEPDDITSPNCTCIDPNTRGLNKLSDILCARHLINSNNEEKLSCYSCFKNGGYYSALGCVYFTDWQTFFEKNVFRLLVGLAGLVALLCIVYAAIQMQLSKGNAEKIKKAQELLTSCIIGLMLILFSVFILRVIGVDILRIPGFR
jgi:hypothetical protein